MIRLIGGVLLFSLALLLSGWILYNLLVERVTDFRGSPIPAVLFAGGLFYVGGKWVFDGWNQMTERRPAPSKKKPPEKRKKSRTLPPLKPLDE